MNKHLIFLILTLSITVICKGQINQKDENGQRHGDWKVNFEGTSKPKFEGKFDHGKEVGEFKFYKKGFYDHPTAIMNFEKHKDSVQVTYYTQAGKPISQGMMLEKKREGQWVYFHQDSDSIMMTEDYKNNHLHGFQKTYFTNGELAEKTEYQNGEKHGESLIYASNGQVTKQLNFKNGQLNGPAVYYHADGEKIMEGSYSQGKKEGEWRFYENGELKETEDYNN